MKIAFIGGGNMGEAILASLLQKKRVIPAGVTVSDVSEARRNYISEKYGVPVTDDNREAVSGQDVIVLAVKPQNITEVLAGLKGALKTAQLVLSIAAGVRIATISRGLSHGRVVRAMPNTPAQIGYGITGWTATPGVTEAQKELARAILGAMGQEIYFDDEKYLDMVTAVSGSGPAYFFLFAEALIDAAVDIGLPRPEAERLVLQTMLGSAHLLEKSGRPAAELRRSVTSKGGTTERALEVFEKGNFTRLVAEAVRAAHQRAIELGNNP
jgi:pyrroline-5-carboxylate reductase